MLDRIDEVEEEIEWKVEEEAEAIQVALHLHCKAEEVTHHRAVVIACIPLPRKRITAADQGHSAYSQSRKTRCTGCQPRRAAGPVQGTSMALS